MAAYPLKSIIAGIRISGVLVGPGHRLEEQNKTIRLFSLSTCPVCKRVKQFFDERRISYENVEVDTLDSGEQWVMTKELRRHNPSASYPTIVIEEVIKGFDKDRLEETLGIK